MAKQRRARLSARPAPSALPEPGRAAEAGAATAGRRPVRRDPRSSQDVAALYARVPATTKRQLDVAAAMLGRNLSDVVTAVLQEHVDPANPEKQAALERLLRG